MKLRFVVVILLAIGTSVASVRLVASAHDNGGSDDPTKAELEKKFVDMLADVVLRGTWQMTTAAGLIIAIPAAAAHNWMEGVVYRAQRTMEDAVTRVFTGQIAPVASDSEPAVSGAEAAQPAE